MQYFLLFLQKYDFEVKYVAGTSNEMKCFDTLSRAPIPTSQVSELSEEEMKAQIHIMFGQLPIHQSILDE